MSSSRTEAIVDVVLPAMGTSIAECTVVEWRKQVGDRVVVDETICEISTDKIDTECPAPIAGTVVEILVQIGETVDVGTVIARIAANDAASEGNGHDSIPNGPGSTSADQSRSPAAAGGPDDLTNGNAPRLSPVVARMLAVHDLDPTTIAGTGRHGRITKKDVEAAVQARTPHPAEALLHSDSPYRPETPVEPWKLITTSPTPPQATHSTRASDELGGIPDQLSRMRQTIGARMRASQETAATCHTVVECDMIRLEAHRRLLGLTALPLVAAATVETLRDFPELNATLDGATITRYERVHLGIAVSLGAGGLIVPVVRDAQNLSPEGLGVRIRDLASRARSRELSPEEVHGATFTITNPGAYGAVLATPVIDLPQVGILDLEAITRRPVVISVDGQESIAIRSMVNLILGWDHRAIDGVYAAQFLSALRARLEQPAV